MLRTVCFCGAWCVTGFGWVVVFFVVDSFTPFVRQTEQVLCWFLFPWGLFPLLSDRQPDEPPIHYIARIVLEPHRRAATAVVCSAHRTTRLYQRGVGAEREAPFVSESQLSTATPIIAPTTQHDKWETRQQLILTIESNDNTLQAPQEPATEKARRANRKAEQPAGCRTVFVKNLPYDVEEDAVSEALAGCGRIASVRLAMWNHTRKLKVGMS